MLHSTLTQATKNHSSSTCQGSHKSCVFPGEKEEHLMPYH